jgi:hypothetical protein
VNRLRLFQRDFGHSKFKSVNTIKPWFQQPLNSNVWSTRKFALGRNLLSKIGGDVRPQTVFARSCPKTVVRPKYK